MPENLWIFVKIQRRTWRTGHDSSSQTITTTDFISLIWHSCRSCWLAFRCSSVRSFPPEGDRKGVVEGTNVVPEALWDEKAFSRVHNALAEWSLFKEGKALGVRLLHCQEVPTRPSAVRQRKPLTNQDSRLARGRGCT